VASSQRARQTVAILAHESDDETVCGIAESLDGHGIAHDSYESTGGDADTIVVVLTAELCRDEVLVHALAGLKDRRLVPVRAEPLDGVEVPKFLADLNWIRWDVADSATREAALFAGLHSDANRYREARSLEAQASAWDSAGRDYNYLLTDRHAVRDAIRRNQAAGDDVLTAPSQRLVDFLEESNISTRAAWWKRNRRWAVRAVIVAAVIAVCVVGFRMIHRLHQADLLAVALLDNQNDDERADLTAVKLSGLVVQQRANGHAIPESAVSRIMLAMAHPWDKGLIGGAGTKALIEAFAFTPDGTVLSADAMGSVTEWNLQDGTPRARHWLSDVGLQYLDGTDDGTSIVTVDYHDVARLTRTSDWHSSELHLPASATRVALAADGRSAAVALIDGTLTSIDFGDDPVSHPIGKFDAILDVRRSGSTGLRALVRSSDRLQVVDVPSGHVIAEREWKPVEFESAALSPTGGQVVVTGADHQLWVAEDSLDFRPTGRAIPDMLNALVIAPNGSVVFASNALGVQVLDPRTGISTKACSSLDDVDLLITNPDGSQLLCAYKGAATMTSIAAMIAAVDPPAGVPIDRTTTATTTGPILAVDATPQGTVRVSTRHRSTLLDAHDVSPGHVTMQTRDGSREVPWIAGPLFGTGAPMVVSVAPDGRSFAVGTTSGDVTVVDVDIDDALLAATRWSAPDHEAVSALAWSADGHDLHIATDRDRWWSTSSCAGCGRDVDALVDAVRDREWLCYPTELIDLFADETVRRLGLRRCPGPQEAE
jgi:WD40 repeat protein